MAPPRGDFSSEKRPGTCRKAVEEAGRLDGVDKGRSREASAVEMFGGML